MFYRVSWHIEKMVREEGDDRRHRSRYVYYRGKEISYDVHKGISTESIRIL